MLNISLCDDDKRMLNQIEELTNKYLIESKIKATISRYASGEEFLEKANIEEIDILFLDIQMEGVDGLDVAEALRKVNTYAELIFITSYDQYMRYLFQYKASGYLSKPIEEDKFNKVLDRVTENIFKRGEKFFYKSDRKEKNVFKKDIVFLESDNHNVLIYLVNSREKYIGKLDDAKEQLHEPDFVQVSKSYIINLNNVRFLDLMRVTLIDGMEIEISRAYKVSAMKTYFKYLEKNKV